MDHKNRQILFLGAVGAVAIAVIIGGLQCVRTYMKQSDRPTAEKIATVMKLTNRVALEKQLTDAQLAQREGRPILPRELVEAAKNDNAETIDEALKKGQDINARDYTIGMTMLHHAAYEGHLDLVRYLLGMGADINAHDGDRSTPLHFAAYRPGNIEIVKYLVAHGAETRGRDDEGKTALDYAVMAEDPQMIKFLKAYPTE